ncbi:hypothetical protein Cylst_0850 [Cylindrospermum stagnale PCC 7417]|uniref:Uncharacterized protein n=1 Tax=Cylindrospermum stagnale PCC 7417 TaxID=56107 RepID=K9WTS6_9NOST|nr:hypothetical protein Cylst_0850 [Cylindrospermum stagnale PCC 7417]
MMGHGILGVFFDIILPNTEKEAIYTNIYTYGDSLPASLAFSVLGTSW